MGEALAQRVADLETENQELWEANNSLTVHLKDVDRWIRALEREKQRAGVLKKMGLSGHRRDRDAVTFGFTGLPKPEAFTLNHQVGEGKVFGLAASLVAEWREVKWIEATSEDTVELAEAKVSRLELEYELLFRHYLNLPPATGPLHYQTRQDQGSERTSYLADARMELDKARRGRSR